MLKTRLLLVAMASLLGACGTPGPATEIRYETVITDTACQWVRPILISRDDMLTDGTADQILAHNETGDSRCHWRKKNGP